MSGLPQIRDHRAIGDSLKHAGGAASTIAQPHGFTHRRRNARSAPAISRGGKPDHGRSQEKQVRAHADPRREQPEFGRGLLCDAGAYAMTALLMLNHRVPHFVTAQRAARWDQALASPIAGKTVLILGVGAIGSATAKLARRFGMRVLGVSRSGKGSKLVNRMYRTKDLTKALPQADFVLSVLPLTTETRGLLGRAELDLLPRHAGVVNIGRGPV